VLDKSDWTDARGDQEFAVEQERNRVAE